MSHRTVWLATWLISASVLAGAQSWTVRILPTRVVDGKPASIAFAMPGAVQGHADMPPIRHVLAYPQPGASPQLKLASSNTDLTLAGPWVRSAPHLKAQGVGVVYVDPPSDAGTRTKR